MHCIKLTFKKLIVRIISKNLVYLKVQKNSTVFPACNFRIGSDSAISSTSRATTRSQAKAHSPTSCNSESSPVTNNVINRAAGRVKKKQRGEEC